MNSVILDESFNIHIKYIAFTSVLKTRLVVVNLRFSNFILSTSILYLTHHNA